MSYKLISCFLLLGLVLMSCSMPASLDTTDTNHMNAPRAWFDSPLPNSVFVPPNPICQIVAHGASPNGIASFELSVNGAVVATIPSPDTQASLVTLTRDCGLSDPGEYHLLLRARRFPPLNF